MNFDAGVAQELKKTCNYNQGENTFDLGDKNREKN